MKRLCWPILILCMVASGVCRAQHWAPLPFTFNSNYAYFLPDSESGNMYITGYFTQVNGRSANVIKWDGDTSITYLNILHGISDITTYHGTTFVSTGDFIYRDSASNWVVTNDALHLTGGFIRIGGRLITGMAAYDPVSGDDTVHIVVWDGAMWKDTLRYDTLWPGDHSWGLKTLAWYKGQLYVAGNINPSSKPLISEILRFDGAHWIDVGGGIQNNGLGHVEQLLVWNNELYVCGTFFEADGAPGNCIARWDGTAWHRLGNGLWSGSGAGALDMAVHNNELYVVGKFDLAGDIPTDGIAKWDGSKWCVVNDYFGGIWRPGQIKSYKGDLYIAGGWYSINGDSSFNHMAKWAGGTFGDTCSMPLSVHQPTGKDEVVIYPNPASDFLRIQAPNVRSIAIYDMRGILTKKVEHYVSATRIDITDFPPGVYLVRVETSGGVYVRKFTRE